MPPQRRHINYISNRGRYRSPPRPECKIVKLPRELQDMIARRCDQSSLLALAMTCWKLLDVAVDALYRSIFIKDLLAMDLFVRLLGASWRKEMCQRTHSFKAFLPWFPRSDGEELNSITVVDNMKELRHLEIRFTLDDYTLNRIKGSLYMPTKLASTLTTCSIRFADMDWPIQNVALLFKHPSLKRLELTGASSNAEPRFSAHGRGTTALQELKLFDCFISSKDLGQILEFPRALEYLTLATHHHSCGPRFSGTLDHTNYFNAIRDNPSGQSLKGLRIDTRHYLKVDVPAPGMHELYGLKYLETSVNHLEPPIKVRDVLRIPKVECPLECLLPPNIEVLKVTPSAYELPVLWNMVNRKSTDDSYLPKLRQIILVQHRYERKSQELRDHSEENYNMLVTEDLYYEYERNFLVSEPAPSLDELRAAYKTVGVELVSILEDLVYKDIFMEEDGVAHAGPAVWELMEDE